MILRSVKDIKNLKGQRVLLRLDLNIYLKDNKVIKDSIWKLEKVLPTLKYLIKKKAKIIIITHLGRPKGRDSKLSLLIIAKYLSKLIKKEIEFWSADFKEYYEDSLALGNGQIAMLENIRYYKGEESNSKRLAKDLSKLGDIYINDAFAVIHRNHASLLAITEYLPSAAGLLLLEEVKILSSINNKKGLIAILGGAKVKTKIKLLKRFINISDKILLGGVLANTFLKAQGYNMGQSIIEKKSIKVAAKLMNKKIILPLDFSIASGIKDQKYEVKDINNIPLRGSALDIGPKTVKEYSKLIKKAKLIIWNGPLGYFENDLFIKGSRKVAKEIIKLKKKAIIGGGETVYLLTKYKLRNKFYFVSTGGGALLSFLEGSRLKSLEKLKKYAR